MRLGHRKDLICCTFLKDQNGCYREPVPYRARVEEDHVEVKDQRAFVCYLRFLFLASGYPDVSNSGSTTLLERPVLYHVLRYTACCIHSGKKKTEGYASFQRGPLLR